MTTYELTGKTARDKAADLIERAVDLIDEAEQAITNSEAATLYQEATAKATVGMALLAAVESRAL